MNLHWASKVCKSDDFAVIRLVKTSTIKREVDTAIACVKQQALSKNISIVSKAKDVTNGLKLKLDWTNFRQVLINLLDNGIKFSKIGSKITISASLEVISSPSVIV